MAGMWSWVDAEREENGMNDKEYAVQKARLGKLAARWIAALGLNWWKVKIVYSRESIENREDGRTCVAQTMVDWHYLQSTITFDMQAVAEEADDDLENQFVHECCHILVNEMRMWAGKEMEADKHEEAMHHEERVASTLANAFIWTRAAGANDAKRKQVRK